MQILFIFSCIYDHLSPRRDFSHILICFAFQKNRNDLFGSNGNCELSANAFFLLKCVIFYQPFFRFATVAQTCNIRQELLRNSCLRVLKALTFFYLDYRAAETERDVFMAQLLERQREAEHINRAIVHFQRIYI